MHIAHYRWRQPLLLAYCQGKATLNPEEEEACTDTIQSAKANLPRAKFLNAWARAEVAEITPTSQNSEKVNQLELQPNLQSGLEW